MKPSRLCFRCWMPRVLLAGLWLAVAPSLRAENPEPAKEAPAKPFEVQFVPNLAYYEGPDADPVRHRLDLYLPKGQKDFPVLFFVHGGAWSHGSKDFFGAYWMLGRFWARQGIGVVVINYRLSPAVTHPEHIKDVARAFAWTHRSIGRYGGRPDQIFVCGHSAGGHLCALLATNGSYLEAEGLSLRDIRGAIPWCGVYHIPEHHPFFEKCFGKDPGVCKEASPTANAGPGDPPFLIIYAEHDLPFCDRPQAEAFGKALRECKVEEQTLEVKDRNHISLFVDACREGDPVARAVREFIDRHTRGK